MGRTSYAAWCSPNRHASSPISKAYRLIFAAEASYHAMYDHCTARYLEQAGVKTDFVRLEDAGLRGNGHMVMIEKNNLDIAAMIDRWVSQNVR